MAKDGDFFISDWLRNRNTLEYISIWKKLYNPYSNYGEFAIIRNQAELNSFKIRTKEIAKKRPDGWNQQPWNVHEGNWLFILLWRKWI